MSDPHLDVAGYALDALTDAERRVFEAHLAGCPDCQQQLREFTETTGWLSADSAATPPAQMRTDVLAGITETPQLSPEREQPQPEQAAEESIRPRHPAPAQQDRTKSRARRPRWRRVGQIAVAAAMAVVVAVGGWVVGRQQLGQSVQAEQNAQSKLFGASDVQIHRQPMRGGQGNVSYVVSQKQNEAMVIISGHPSAGKGQTFQLWTMHGAKGTEPEPDSLFSGSESGPVWLKGNVVNAAALAITVEPDGGSQQPTTKPFAIQKL